MQYFMQYINSQNPYAQVAVKETVAFEQRIQEARFWLQSLNIKVDRSVLIPALHQTNLEDRITAFQITGILSSRLLLKSA